MPRQAAHGPGIRTGSAHATGGRQRGLWWLDQPLDGDVQVSWRRLCPPKRHGLTASSGRERAKLKDGAASLQAKRYTRRRGQRWMKVLLCSMYL